MKKILILSDSLALPRQHPQAVLYSETYPQLLKNHFEVCQVSIGGATIVELYNQIYYITNFNPDFVLLQSGIVDCAPRAISKFEQMLIAKLPFFSKFFERFIREHKFKLRKIRNITYTNIDVYENNLLQVRKAFPNAAVMAIGIVPSTKEYEKVVPGIGQNINRYNDAIKNIFNNYFIDISDIDNSCIMSDHIHLNSKGHQFIFTKIFQILGLNK